MRAEDPKHPAEITVIVTSASNLQTGKHGKCKASVIFGVGTSKFRTQVVESTSPKWSERSIVPVSEGDSSALVFQVTRKERQLGEVVVQLENIPSRSAGVHTAQLPDGASLSYECWVNKSYSSSMARACVTPKKMRSGRLGSIRGSFKSRPNSETMVRASSVENISETIPEQVLAPQSLSVRVEDSLSTSPLSEQPTARRSSFSRVLGDRRSRSKEDREPKPSPAPQPAAPEAPPTPKVTGISPRDGSMQGSTLITLRGENLGTSAEDIKTITVCGKQCNLADLEYLSSHKLTCRTPPGDVGVGPVEVVTVEHGRGSSTVTFTYWNPAQEPQDRIPLLVETEPPGTAISEKESSTSISASSTMKKKKFGGSGQALAAAEESIGARNTVIEALHSRVLELEEENKRLNEYISKLISKAISTSPSILEC